MKRILLLLMPFMVLLFPKPLTAQGEEEKTRNWEVSAHVGHQPLSLGIPSFRVLHPAVGVSLWRQWNPSAKSQWWQQASLDFFSHRNLQQALRLYTEVGYRWRSSKGLLIAPFFVGGGYVMSFPDLTTLELDENGNYQENNVPVRHNFMISLGPEIGYQFSNLIKGKSLDLWLSYRIQVQGPFAEGTVPVIAYSPLWIRCSLPLD